MSWSDLASIIAAVAFLLLVLFSLIPIVKLGKVFSDLSQAINNIGEQAAEAIKESTDVIGQVNGQLEKVDRITSAATRSVEDISALTTLVTATLGRPLIRISAFSYAVRRLWNENLTAGRAADKAEQNMSADSDKEVNQ